MALKLQFQKRFLQTVSRRLPANSLMSEIDRIIGGNIFKNLDWLLNDEDTNIGNHFTNLSETMHPVLNTIRGFIETKSIPYGLVINLFSEIPTSTKSPNISLQIKDQQQILAKVTEMLRMATLLHNDIVTITPTNKQLHKGNKISLLCGDYLLAKCLTSLATLKNQFYVEYMSSALRDLTLGRTLGPMDKNDNIYPSKPTKLQDVSILNDLSHDLSDYKTVLGHPLNEWILRASLKGGNLLGKGISSVLRISNFPESIQNVGFYFGKYFALILKANEDIYQIINNNKFCLTNLVVYIHIKKDYKFYEEIEKYKNNLNEVNYENLVKKMIKEGSLEESFEFRNVLISSAISCLSIFDESYPKELMKELIKELEGLKC